MSNYITVSEFSKRAGITKQAVYLQLNNKLKPYFKILNGKKMLDISALELYNNINNNQDFKSTNNQESKENQSTLNQENQLIQVLQTTIETLREQLAEKDKVIIELTETIKIQAQSINAAHHAELAEQLKIESSEDREEREKKGFFKRLFNRG